MYIEMRRDGTRRDEYCMMNYFRFHHLSSLLSSLRTLISSTAKGRRQRAYHQYQRREKDPSGRRSATKSRSGWCRIGSRCREGIEDIVRELKQSRWGRRNVFIQFLLLQRHIRRHHGQLERLCSVAIVRRQAKTEHTSIPSLSTSPPQHITQSGRGVLEALT